MLVVSGSVLVTKSLTFILCNLVKGIQIWKNKINYFRWRCYEENSNNKAHSHGWGGTFSRVIIRKDVCEEKSIEKEIWHQITSTFRDQVKKWALYFNCLGIYFMFESRTVIQTYLFFSMMALTSAWKTSTYLYFPRLGVSPWFLLWSS